MNRLTLFDGLMKESLYQHNQILFRERDTREIRRSRIAHVDETSSPLFGPAGKKIHWLWAMVNSTISFFMILDTRSARLCYPKVVLEL